MPNVSKSCRTGIYYLESDPISFHPSSWYVYSLNRARHRIPRTHSMIPTSLQHLNLGSQRIKFSTVSNKFLLTLEKVGRTWSKIIGSPTENICLSIILLVGICGQAPTYNHQHNWFSITHFGSFQVNSVKLEQSVVMSTVNINFF